MAAYQSISNDVATLQSVADTLESPSGWQAWIPSSTTEDATATVGAGAIGGSITFSVDALAQADSEISSGSVSSQTAQITSGPLLVAVGGGALGIGHSGLVDPVGGQSHDRRDPSLGGGLLHGRVGARPLPPPSPPAVTTP